MKKIWLLMAIVFLAGCMTVRTYEVEKPRIDTSVEGNRGYLSGTPKEEQKDTSLGPTRKISVVEIEIGSSTEKAPAKKVSEQEVSVDESEDLGGPEEFTEVIKEAAETQGGYTSYKVEKNDTLQKISNKFYGTTRNWNLIYQANKDVIKSPDKLYPGTVIKIPDLK